MHVGPNYMYALELYLSHRCVVVGPCGHVAIVANEVPRHESNPMMARKLFSAFVRLLPSVDRRSVSQPASLGIARLPANTGKVQGGAPPYWLSVFWVTNIFVDYNVATRFA